MARTGDSEEFMAADDDKQGIGYVPDESDQDADAEAAKASAQAAHEEAAHRRKGAAKRSAHRPAEADAALHNAVAERNEFKDKYLRGLAEMDNFRKRMLKERDEFQKYVLSEILLDLLQVYDNLERALKAKTAEQDKGLVSGVEMIRKQFLDLLKKYQVTEIEALGRTFDPSRHEALSKEEREGISQPVVVEVYQKGFTYHNKLLRPALTKVAVPAGPPLPKPEAVVAEAAVPEA
ncbi:MAG TPA: nucleotide exchange factor GrpE [Candidatus Aminicenantes bacterium]|nr:nucleotide exchange factor GrpE [Candidatus Aminicenantes bacterium]